MLRRLYILLLISIPLAGLGINDYASHDFKFAANHIISSSSYPFFFIQESIFPKFLLEKTSELIIENDINNSLNNELKEDINSGSPIGDGIILLLCFIVIFLICKEIMLMRKNTFFKEKRKNHKMKN